jgi:hypothetical protein
VTDLEAGSSRATPPVIAPSGSYKPEEGGSSLRQAGLTLLEPTLEERLEEARIRARQRKKAEKKSRSKKG